MVAVGAVGVQEVAVGALVVVAVFLAVVVALVVVVVVEAGDE